MRPPVPSPRPGSAGIAEPESQWRQTEAELREELARLRALVESRSDLAYVARVDEAGTIQLAWVADNGTFSQNTGHSPEALTSGQRHEVLYEPDFGRVGEHLHRLLGGEPSECEYRIRCADSSLRWVCEIARPIVKTGSNRVVRIFGAIRDIQVEREAADALVLSEARLRTVANSAPLVLWAVDRSGVFTLSEGRSLRAIGLEPGAVLGRSAREIYQDSPEVVRGIERSLEGEEMTTVHEVGDVVFETRMSPARSSRGEVSGVIGVSVDITKRRRTEEALEQALEQARCASAELERTVTELRQRAEQAAVLNEMGDLLQSCNTDTEAFSVIRRYAGVLSLSASGALGAVTASRKLVEIVATWGEPSTSSDVFDSTACWALRRARIHVGDASHPESLCCLPETERMTSACSVLCLPLIAHGEILGVLHLRGLSTSNGGLERCTDTEARLLAESESQLAVSFAERISLSLANLRLRERMQRQAERDPLTGTFNRRFMEDILDREVRRARRAGTPLSVLLVDVDRFKSFNDSRGHLAGDLLLRALAGLLRRSFRTEDFVCRYGGDEFVVVMPASTARDAAVRAEHLRHGAEILEIGSAEADVDPGSITVSVGVACLDEVTTDPDSLLRAADEALYRAKIDGRNRVAWQGEGSG